MADNTVQSKKLRGILVPLFLSIFIGILIFYGGEAYQAIGLAGIDTARVVLGYLLGIAQFLALAALLQHIVQYVFLDWLVASTIGSQPPRLLSQLTAFLVYLFAFTAIIGVVFKKDLTVIFAASGVVGMALQNLILDIFAGLALNLDRMIKIGDSIQLHRIGDKTIEGKVTEISWRTLHIADNSYNNIIIPNRLVSASTITNFSAPQPFSETGIPVVLDGKIPVDRAMRILKAATVEALSSLPLPPDLPEPAVTVSEILHVPRSVKYNILISVPFERWARSRNLVQQCVLRHLNFAGIRPTQQEFPSPDHLALLITTTGIFCDLEEKAALLLAKQARLRRISSNSTIIHNGDIAEMIFLVIEGLVVAETRRKIGSKPSPPKTLGPGNVIGGTAMFMNDVYDATVLSKTDCLLFEIDYPLLEKLFTQYPETVQVVSKNIAQLTVVKNAAAGSHWQMSEADVIAEILRNLKRQFINLKLD